MYEGTQFERTEMLIGSEGVRLLSEKNIAVFGIGGVGSFAVEALARAGIGKLTLIDNDTVSVSNINRQLIATHKTIGKPKVLAATERVSEINPSCEILTLEKLLTPENIGEFELCRYDYVIDAIDMVSSKLALAKYCDSNNIPLISSMGTGNKLTGEGFTVADIYKTSVCPLARVMRYELKRLGVKRLKVVYSPTETVVQSRPPASISFVPPIAGMLLAGEAVRDLLKAIPRNPPGQ